VGGVIVNMRIDKESVDAKADEFVRNRIAMQDGYMKEIEQQFDNLVRSVLPLYDTEVRGVAMLERMADMLFA
jgi:anion-transporting  ArsA/GET3 family ATPase